MNNSSEELIGKGFAEIVGAIVSDAKKNQGERGERRPGWTPRKTRCGEPVGGFSEDHRNKIAARYAFISEARGVTYGVTPDMGPYFAVPSKETVTKAHDAIEKAKEAFDELIEAKQIICAEIETTNGREELLEIAERFNNMGEELLRTSKALLKLYEGRSDIAKIYPSKSEILSGKTLRIRVLKDPLEIIVERID